MGSSSIKTPSGVLEAVIAAFASAIFMLPFAIMVNQTSVGLVVLGWYCMFGISAAITLRSFPAQGAIASRRVVPALAIVGILLVVQLLQGEIMRKLVASALGFSVTFCIAYWGAFSSKGPER